MPAIAANPQSEIQSMKLNVVLPNEVETKKAKDVMSRISTDGEPAATELATLVKNIITKGLGNSCKWQTKTGVKKKATENMAIICTLIENKDIERLLPVVIGCINHPENVPEIIHLLGATTFVQAVDSATLSIMVLLLGRGLNEHATAIKRKATLIIDNMSKLNLDEFLQVTDTFLNDVALNLCAAKNFFKDVWIASLAYGTKILLNRTALRLKRGHRYGLCGAKGCGMFTLMRAIANEQVEGFPPRSELKTVYVEHDIDGSEAMVTKMATGELSGGWKMKLALARAMLVNADILLLDEPTNHLDREYLGALDMATKVYGGGVVIVTHNREFTEALCNEVCMVDAQGNTVKAVQKKKKKLTSKELRKKKKKERMERRKRGEEVYTTTEEL